MAMARTLAMALIPALWALCAPATARAADCDPAADKVFAHPYGEPSVPCPTDSVAAPSEKDKELPNNIFSDDRGPRKLQNIGISGIEAGATIAGLGGFLYVISLFLNPSTPENPNRSEEVTRIGGISLAAAGGLVFLAGGALLIADYAMAPAPTPDRKGAQLTFAFRW